MLYIIGEYFESLAFLKSMYLRGFISFTLSFVLVLILGKPFINYLKVKKFGEKIKDAKQDHHL